MFTQFRRRTPALHGGTGRSAVLCFGCPQGVVFGVYADVRVLYAQGVVYAGCPAFGVYAGRFVFAMCAGRSCLVRTERSCLWCTQDVPRLKGVQVAPRLADRLPANRFWRPAPRRPIADESLSTFRVLPTVRRRIAFSVPHLAVCLFSPFGGFPPARYGARRPLICDF